jgi:hypothetical protein
MYVIFYDDSRHFCTYFSTGKMWDDSAVILDKKNAILLTLHSISKKLRKNRD